MLNISNNSWYYQRNKKKTKRKEKKLCKQLLKYLLRLLQGLEDLQKSHQFNFTNKEQKLLRTIHTVYEQQHALLYGTNEKNSPSYRIDQQTLSAAHS
jgi:hypothetical protein